MVINQWIFTNCYASKSRHSIKIRTAIAQTVLPCYTVTPCGLMLVIKKQELKINNLWDTLYKYSINKLQNVLTKMLVQLYNTKCIQFFIDPIGWSARRQVRFAPQRIRQQRAFDTRAVTGLPASTCLLFALQTGHYCFALTVVPCVSPNNILTSV